MECIFWASLEMNFIRRAFKHFNKSMRYLVLLNKQNIPGKTGIPIGILFRGTGAGAGGLFGGRDDSPGIGAGGLSEGCGRVVFGNG